MQAITHFEVPILRQLRHVQQDLPDRRIDGARYVATLEFDLGCAGQ